jgi:hypothetical protein
VALVARFWPAYAGAAHGLFASTRGQFASASTSLSRGSMTIAVAPFGRYARPTLASTCSTSSWIAASIVSSSRAPGRAGRVSRTLIDWPSASLTSRRSPSLPTRSSLRAYSMPDSPRPSVPTVPRSCEARNWRG